IPAALGAKVADVDRPVACVLGDGAAMFSVQELMTATELGLGIPFVIVDNGGYAEIEGQMVERDIEPFAVRLARPDFARLGESMGGAGVRIAEADIDEALPGAVAAALERRVPTAIHITADSLGLTDREGRCGLLSSDQLSRRDGGIRNLGPIQGE